MKIFKIRRISDGKYAKKGAGFTKNGANWAQRGHVTLHLNSTCNVYDGCELMEYNISEDGSSVLLSRAPMEEIVTANKERLKIKEALRAKESLRLKLERLIYEQEYIEKNLKSLMEKK